MLYRLLYQLLYRWTQIAKFTARSLHGVLALLVSRVLAQVSSLVVGLALVHWLDDSIFGAYSLATTTIGLVGILVDLGLDTILIRETASNPAHSATLIKQANWLRNASGGLVLVGLGILGSLSTLLGRSDLLLIGAAGLLPRAWMRSQLAVLIGAGYTRHTAWVDGLAALAVSAFTLLFVLGRFGADGASAALWGLFAGNVVGWLLSLLIGLNLRRTVFESVASRPLALVQPTMALLTATAPFLLINLAGTLFQSLDLYMVKQFHWQATTPDALALYAAPFRILNVLLLVPTTWGTVALGRYVRATDRSTDPTVQQRMFRQDLGLLTAIGFLLSLLCMVGAEPLTRLGLGERYLASAHILALIGWMTLPVCASAPLIALLTARQHQRSIAACVIGAGGLSLILNIGWAALSAGSTTVDGLLGVAAIKVAVMTALLVSYFVSSWVGNRLAATSTAYHRLAREDLA